ncbi:MAG: hypothetical protein JRJ66_16425 [Deltaproteobacteria bacterium]|nr:hypothetical protein [Deltaproteobacteria bacterium]
MKRKEVMIMQRNRLARDRSFLAGVNREMLEPEITRGAQSELNKGSLPLMIVVLIIIVGMCIGAFLWSGRAHGAERKFVFVAYDVSGSTDVDRINNERAVVRIIQSLKPGDEILIMNVQKETFSEPEYMLHGKMPSRAGYFREELRRKQIRLISEFRKRCEKMPKERPDQAHRHTGQPLRLWRSHKQGQPPGRGLPVWQDHMRCLRREM